MGAFNTCLWGIFVYKSRWGKGYRLYKNTSNRAFPIPPIDGRQRGVGPNYLLHTIYGRTPQRERETLTNLPLSK
jgi:hypothetical protein